MEHTRNRASCKFCDQHIRLTHSQLMPYTLTENKQKNLLFCVIVQRDRKPETLGSNLR